MRTRYKAIFCVVEVKRRVGRQEPAKHLLCELKLHKPGKIEKGILSIMEGKHREEKRKSKSLIRYHERIFVSERYRMRELENFEYACENFTMLRRFSGPGKFIALVGFALNYFRTLYTLSYNNIKE